VGAVAAVVVRDAVIGDLDDLLRLLGELADGHHDALPPPASMAATVLAAVLDQSSRHLLIAEVGGVVAGTADCTIVANLTHGGAPWAVVENVVVDEAARRRGVGHRLMEEVVARCRAAGCYKIQLLSQRYRHGAHVFYEGLGFEATAVGFRRYLA